MVRVQEVLAIIIIICCQLNFFTLDAKREGDPDCKMLFHSLMPLSD